MSAASWKIPADIRAQFGSVDFVGDDQVIFDIDGNKYRLIVRVSNTFGRVLVKFVGTHKAYEAIDVETV